MPATSHWHSTLSLWAQFWLLASLAAATVFAGGRLRETAPDTATVFLVAAPGSNTGDFRAPFAGHEPGKNDYTSGMNIDLGPWATPRWQTRFAGWRKRTSAPIATRSARSTSSTFAAS